MKRTAALGMLMTVAGALFAVTLVAQDIDPRKSVIWQAGPDGRATTHFVAITAAKTHDNLAIYLVHGVDEPLPRPTLTLKQALELHQVKVHETGNVNQLAVENRSDKWDVYIQAGEIVRGGKQDRVLGVDLVLRPGSGRVPIQSFCVEQGRWQQRGGENAAAFEGSTNIIAGNAMKVAVRKAKKQQSVWDGVKRVQDRLARNVDSDVRVAASPSSLELSLESEAVQKRTAAYIEKLAPLVEAHPTAVGFLFAVNGEIRSGDVYCSRELFVALWPKLLEAAAVEALADRPKHKVTTDVPRPPSVADVVQFVMSVEGKPAESEPIPQTDVWQARYASDECLLFESHYGRGGGADYPTWLHRSYIAKEQATN